MRKIESLQENEAIIVPNVKYRRKLLKEASKQGFNMKTIDEHAPDKFELIITSGKKNLLWNYEFSNQYTKLPASDFIKKSKTKQRLKALEEKVAGLIASTVVETELKKIKDESKLDQPKEIDFSVAGQYVIDSVENVIVVTTDSQVKDNMFTGTCVYSESKESHVGEHYTGWNTNAFKPLTEPFTINPKA